MAIASNADGIFTPQWYNLVDIVSKERTLIIAFSKAIAASILYAPFANGLFLAGARALRYGLKVSCGLLFWARNEAVARPVTDFRCENIRLPY